MSITLHRTERQATRLGYCDGCQTHVPLNQITGYARHGGNTPLCPECALLVTCDCCRKEVPFGLCQVDRDHEVTCNWCAELPGFWPEPPVELRPAHTAPYDDPFASLPDMVERVVERKREAA